MKPVLIYNCLNVVCKITCGFFLIDEDKEHIDWFTPFEVHPPGSSFSPLFLSLVASLSLIRQGVELVTHLYLLWNLSITHSCQVYPNFLHHSLHLSPLFNPFQLSQSISPVVGSHSLSVLLEQKKKSYVAKLNIFKKYPVAKLSFNHAFL